MTQVGWNFWLWWVLASAVGFFVIALVNLIVNFFAHSHDARFVALLVAGTLGGFVGGVLQWLVLRGKISRAGWWVLASAVGFLVGGPLGAFVGGVLQWLVLRGKISRAGWWVLASVVGFLVGGILGGADLVGVVAVTDPVGVLLQQLVLLGEITQGGWWTLASAMRFLVDAFMSGAVTGVITGGALVWLLRQPRREAQIVVGRPPNDD